MKPDLPYNSKVQFSVILFVYIIFASIFGFAYRYAMNPDGITLLRLAGYIAEGNFQQSVTRVWSPLISWLISPFIFLGFEGLASARIAIALSGAGLLLSVWFMALRFDLSQNMRFIALLIASLLISFWTMQTIAADLLLAALVLCYIYLVTDTDILTNRRISLFCGITGGASYLAHHYAFPFFLVHFPLLLLLRGYFDRDKEGFPLKRVLISWGIGTIGFLTIASVWIGAVSVKYGHFTISSKGPIARAAVGPKHKGHPFFTGGLFKPKSSYAIHVYEDPSEVKFNTWSPFESKEHFIYQLKLIKDNCVFIYNHFVNKSPFFTYAFIIGTLALMVIAFLLNPLNKKKRFLYSWFILTFCVYCSGFLLITARSPRRFYALMTIFLLLSFHFFDELINFSKSYLPIQRKKMLTVYLMIIAFSAFTLKPGVNLLKSLQTIITIDQVNPYKEIAEEINTIKFPGPYAIIRSSQKLTTDYYLNYFLNKQLLGRPLSSNVHGITEELKSAAGKSLLIFNNSDIVEKFKLDGRYIHLASVKLKGGERYKNAAGIIITRYEIITGWDDEVNVFTLK